MDQFGGERMHHDLRERVPALPRGRIDRGGLRRVVPRCGARLDLIRRYHGAAVGKRREAQRRVGGRRRRRHSRSVGVGFGTIRFLEVASLYSET